ncbi:hypothetical protein IAG44_22190 [Streptomyces roseirectus]|uniref:Uncharacterized protein n=1 Tax=Streptomyces roseirectus TaxID=2768066 RepID=A0A7H0IGD9_9ACTN|nr:hypothetical protein [Streptomyces roseirectus]QNP71855.1 hypothetical protein IAG44_22190 [Streptomyces roseirectus]
MTRNPENTPARTPNEPHPPTDGTAPPPSGTDQTPDEPTRVSDGPTRAPGTANRSTDAPDRALSPTDRTPEEPAHPHTTTPHTRASTPHARTEEPPATAHLRWLLRLHRPALATWAVLVLALTALQLAGWVPFVDTALRSARYGEGGVLRHDDLFGYATTALYALPLIVGAWSGAALFGRDLESGTARLTWSQGVSPMRWLAGGLLVPAVVITASAGALVALHRLTWVAGDSESVHVGQWYEEATFYTNGPTAVALGLAGLAGGALAGLLFRRTLPALALGAGIALAVREATVWVTPYLWPTVTDTTSLQAGYRSSGFAASYGVVTSSGAHVADPGCGPVVAGGSCQAVYDKVDGAGFYVTYHPESHFWPLQLTGTGFVTVVAGLLTLAAFLVLRRTTGPLGSGVPGAGVGAGAVRKSARRIGARLSGARPNGTRKDGTRKDRTSQAGTGRDLTGRAGTRKDSTRKNGVSDESVLKEATA